MSVNTQSSAVEKQQKSCKPCNEVSDNLVIEFFL